MKKIVGILITLSFLLTLLAQIYLYKGFNYKDKYYKNEDFPILSQNTYVGGDAYNYIINGTYFTGCMALGGAYQICSVILFCTALKIKSNDKIEKQVQKLKIANISDEDDSLKSNPSLNT